MNIYVSLGLCFVPFILCFAGFKLFSKIKFSTELIASLLGLLAVLPVTFLQFYLVDIKFSSSFMENRQILSLFLKALLFNGVIEEVLKAVFMFFLPKKNVSFSSFFMAALLCGLCLGCFESSVYFLQYLQKANQRGAQIIYHLIFIRMISSDLIHMFCAGLGGLFVWSCKSKNPNFVPLIFAVLMHGLYDFFAGFSSNLRWFSVVAILFAILECRINYENLKPVEKYVKEPEPAKDNQDKTIETALKDAPVYSPKK